MIFILTILFYVFCIFPCWALHNNNGIPDNDLYCYVRFSDATEPDTELKSETEPETGRSPEDER
jgi:hypothetical protein